MDRSSTHFGKATNSGQAMIACRGIQLAFQNGRNQQSVLDGLSLEVNEGQIVSLLGPSGCGKSTLLRVIAGLIDADSGNATVCGQIVSKTMPIATRHSISFIFQEPALLPWRTVWQNIMLPLEIRRQHRRSENRDRVEHLLSTVGFARADWNKFPSQLSGGMKMRASIARAMSTQPTILLLDEPFAALDDMLRSKLNDLLLDISMEQRCTMLFVTHNIAEAIYLSHSIAIMSRGRIAEVMQVPLAFPRESRIRCTSEFAKYYGSISDSLVRSNA
ncbi:MAG: ABC transporter ATP-binding protein [Pirellula sp.]